MCLPTSEPVLICSTMENIAWIYIRVSLGIRISIAVLVWFWTLDSPWLMSDVYQNEVSRYDPLNFWEIYQFLDL
jgi:hypothetical protein